MDKSIVKLRIVERDGPVCFLCGDIMLHWDEISVISMVPVSIPMHDRATMIDGAQISGIYNGPKGAQRLRAKRLAHDSCVKTFRVLRTRTDTYENMSVKLKTHLVEKHKASSYDKSVINAWLDNSTCSICDAAISVPPRPVLRDGRVFHRQCALSEKRLGGELHAILNEGPFGPIRCKWCDEPFKTPADVEVGNATVNDLEYKQTRTHVRCR